MFRLFDNPKSWTIRRLVQNTYFHEKERFKDLGISKDVSSIVIEKQTVYDGLKDSSPHVVYDIYTRIPSSNSVKKDGIDTGRRYGEVEIRIGSLSVDERDIELVTSSGSKLTLSSPGNEWISLRTGKRLTSKAALTVTDKAATFLLDKPLLSVIKYLMDSGILQ